MKYEYLESWDKTIYQNETTYERSRYPSQAISKLFSLDDIDLECI